MRVFVLLIFSTFVLNSFVRAAPSTSTEMQSAPYDMQDDPLLKDRAYLSALDKPAKYQIGASLGYGSGNYVDDEVVSSPYLRLHFATIQDSHPDWEIFADLNQENLIGLFFGKRNYFWTEKSYTPFWTISAGTFLDANDGLANIAAVKRIRTRLSAGLGTKITTEIGAGYAVAGPDFFIQFGIPWNIK